MVAGQRHDSLDQQRPQNVGGKSSRLSSCHGGKGRANAKGGCGSGGAVLRMDAKQSTMHNFLLTSCYKLLLWYARIGVIALVRSLGILSGLAAVEW